MANTYTQLYIHLIFVVQDRESLITKNIEDDIYKYITGIIKNKNHKLIIINGMQDHVHILLSMNPDESISVLAKELKRCTTNYINENILVKGKFSWQKGYAAFSYSKSAIEKLIKYIEGQKEHHKRKTFREEYLVFLKKYEVEFDEKYIFKNIE